MAISDTSMGGSREGFPETAGFSVLGDPGLSPEERRARLNRLFSMYWRPVYAFLRVSGAGTIEDAKDLAQRFFQHVFEADLISRFDPAKGRFRHFLKGALKLFLSKSRRDESREKRGGGAPLLSLDTTEFDTEAFLADARREDPDRLFDRQWAEDVVGHSVLRLKETLAAEGKEAVFRAYEAIDLCPADRERPSYAEAGRALGISEDQVRNHLHVARTRLQQVILKICSEYVGSSGELEEEVRELFQRGGP